MKNSDLTRREMLKKISLYMGGAVSTPTMAAILSGCGETSPGVAGDMKLEWSPQAFSPAQAMLVRDMAETIIPRTNTPGARDVGVPQLVDNIVAQAFTAEEREQYLAGLTKFGIRVQNRYNQPFSLLDEQEKYNLVAQLNEAVVNKTGDEDPFYNNEKAFFRTTKELTLLGFFRSEVGATQVLQYSPVPGRYNGCVPLSEIGKTWATS